MDDSAAVSRMPLQNANSEAQQSALKVRFWKIAPGDGAKYWDECRAGQFICIGWDEVGDMSQYQDEATFKVEFREQGYSKPETKWREVWDFAKEVRAGDIIIANKGLTSIVGIGTATGEYRYDDRREHYKHCTGVRWECITESKVPAAAQEVVKDWAFRTVKQLTEREYQQLIVMEPRHVVWQRLNSFDLLATNPNALNVSLAKELFERMRSAANPKRAAISEHIRNEFGQWLDRASGVLPSTAYVTLSNWFLSNKAYSESERGKLAAQLWDVLFACRPPRLSSMTARNELIIPEAFERWWLDMKAKGAATDDEGVTVVVKDEPRAQALSSRYSDICRTTYLPEMFFRNCERLLETKKQIILQGAPGTGKTFVAEQLATLWAGDRSRVKVVQFHESFGYEDFVHGIKPRVDPETEKTAFYPEPGLFLRFCEEIRSGDPAQQYVLLIDEINRAKTARVFGELLYLLEYRNREVELQSGQMFSIPDNLYIIGTMNTTDKSIALVDYALRRRFAFVDLVPVKNGASVVLRKWLDGNAISNAAEVDRLFIALNEAIAQKDEALMVGHSYFMQTQAVNEKRFSDDLLRFLWEYYVLPLIAEYEYQLSRSELEERYGLDALRSTTRAKAATV